LRRRWSIAQETNHARVVVLYAREKMIDLATAFLIGMKQNDHLCGGQI
jgi:hypothetical protein